ncbi:putative mediator of RNA polymerase II transcription subunit 26 isoform X2 [Drosophila tropicalis]|uniref:putative mediator of RNA polymerase II transcription subunit 26 isoform X2 n=1 Tax=Drosophila tropicalis TaxID=46794 RepID=UPI0035AC216A
MAVFLINVCKYNGCGITFPSLSDLISHIEDTHIDYDPKVVEQKEQAQPACLPLSYVLRFVSEDTRKEATTFLSNAASAATANNNTNTGGNGGGGNGGHGNGHVELKRKLAIKHHSYSMSSSNRSNTPTGSEMDEDEMVVTESEDSDDSWTTEEFSSEFIMRYGSRHSGGGSNGTPGNEKPFACPVPGCKKRYKNVNGIKYHSKNGHKKDGRVRKGYKCHCGKSYKTAQGLKNHALLTHNSQPETVLTTQQVANAAAAGVINTSSSSATTPNPIPPLAATPTPTHIQRSASPSQQSLGSLSPSSISNMSSSASSCHGGGGSSSLSSNHNNNLLQQLTVTNLPNVQPQQQQQQHQNGSLATETSYSCLYTNNSNHNNNSSDSNSIKQQQIVVGRRPAHTTSSSITSTSTTKSSPMQISPTFIEHKYSALAIKEKFFSNLRAVSSKTAASAAGSGPCSDNIEMVTSAGGGGGGVVVGAAGGGLRTVAAVGQMCALQNEHIHQNLYKKTIN